MAQLELGREVLHLRVEKPEGARILNLGITQFVNWQLFVWLSNFAEAMRVGATIAELADLSLLPVLACLSLEVVVRDVEHFIFDFNRERLQDIVISQAGNLPLPCDATLLPRVQSDMTDLLCRCRSSCSACRAGS